MRKITVISFLIIGILFSCICYAENCIGPKLKGFCLGMTYNEVVGNMKKLNLTIKREDFDDGSYILTNEGKSVQYAFKIRGRDGILFLMSFSFDMFNAGDLDKQAFVEMFCKNYNIPKMEYKYDGEWMYEYKNIKDGYGIKIYDKYVKLYIISKKSQPEFD